MKKKSPILLMICLIKKFKSGVEIAPLFIKNETKKFSQRAKRVLGDFALNSKMVSKHQAGEYWAPENALNIRGK